MSEIPEDRKRVHTVSFFSFFFFRPFKMGVSSWILFNTSIIELMDENVCLLNILAMQNGEGHLVLLKQELKIKIV